MSFNRMFNEKTPLLKTRSRSSSSESNTPPLFDEFKIIDAVLQSLRTRLKENKQPLTMDEIRLLAKISETCKHFHNQITLGNLASPFQLNPVNLLMSSLEAVISDKEDHNNSAIADIEYLQTLTNELKQKLKHHLNFRRDRLIHTEPPENSTRWNIPTVESHYSRLYAPMVMLLLFYGLYKSLTSQHNLIASLLGDEVSGEMIFNSTSDVLLFIGVNVAAFIFLGSALGLSLFATMPLEFLTRVVTLLKSTYDLNAATYYDPNAIANARSDFDTLTAAEDAPINKPSAMQLFYRVQEIRPIRHGDQPLQRHNQP